MSSTGRPLRADARRNRDKVIEAARAAIAREGASASMRTIAEVAGVGLATVYRQFPTKRAMLEAILGEQVEALIERAEQLADASDPGEAFEEFFTAAVTDARYPQDLFIEALTDAGLDPAAASPGTDPRMVVATERLLVRAQQAGAVRGDLAMADLALLLSAACFAADRARADPAQVERVVAVFRDGLAARS